MHQLDFWTNSAEAMELTIEGNRLIVREIGQIMRAVWHGMAEAMTHRLQSLMHRLPPV
jgi:hypothetical protein